MSAISFLRITRKFKSADKQQEHPFLETLIEQEGEKISDGYHYARWITPLAGFVLAFGCFMPLALTVSPWFWMGTGVLAGLGGLLGTIFHLLARRISRTQIQLRKKCYSLGLKMISLRSLLGSMPPLSPAVAEILDEAARTYLLSRPNETSTQQSTSNSYFAESLRKAQVGLESAMLQMLSLADADTPSAQEAELNRGWAQPLLAEMKATLTKVESSRKSVEGSLQGNRSSGPIAALLEAQADLDRFETAVSELQQETKG